MKIVYISFVLFNYIFLCFLVFLTLLIFFLVCLFVFLLFTFHIHSVHPPLSAGRLNLLPNFQKGRLDRLDRTSTLRGGLLEKRGIIFFRRGGGEGAGCCNFYKKKLKSKTFNDKKFYKQNFVSLS